MKFISIHSKVCTSRPAFAKPWGAFFMLKLLQKVNISAPRRLQKQAYLMAIPAELLI
jgi:hypothetical protein